MGNYSIISIQKIKSLRGLTAQQNHNDRNYRMNHVDENLSFQNQELISTGGLSYVERWEERVRQVEAKTEKKMTIRSNAVYALDVVTTFSHDAQENLGFDLEAWCEENIAYMKETFGEENILAMTLHMDEETPHIHTQIIPIDEKGKLNAKKILGGPADMKRLQSRYSSRMRQFGLERGDSNSKIHTNSRKRWYKMVESVAKVEAPRVKDGETIEEYSSRLDLAFQNVKMAAEKTIQKAYEKYERSQTRQAQIFEEYAYAINLQHILEEEFGGDMTKVKERLKTYQLMEKSVPRKTLDTILTKTMEKFPPENSISFFRYGKKKRHAKWESLPDLSAQNGSANMQEQVGVPIATELAIDPNETVFSGGRR